MYLSSQCLTAEGVFEVFLIFFVSELSRFYANTEKEKDRIESEALKKHSGK